MKGTIAGAILAVLFLGGLFAAAHYLPHPALEVASVTPVQIPPGFVGNRMVGAWDLLCSRAPSPQPDGTGQQSAPSVAGHCRLAHGYVNGNGKLILIVSFRMFGPQNKLAMLLRFPPVARKGDVVILKFGNTGLRLPVFDCPAGASACIAAGTLISAAEKLVASAGAAQVILPPGADGKRITIGIRLDGLAAGLQGLHRAES